MSDTPSTIEIWDALDDDEKKLHAHLLEIELGEAKQLIHETASGLVQERENMLSDVLSAQAERDQWRTMAQELASKTHHRAWCAPNQGCSCGLAETLSRFNELNNGGTPVSPHQTLATAIARYAKHRFKCPMSQAGLTEANQCQCGLSSLLKQLE